MAAEDYDSISSEFAARKKIKITHGLRKGKKLNLITPCMVEMILLTRTEGAHNTAYTSKLVCTRGRTCCASKRHALAPGAAVLHTPVLGASRAPHLQHFYSSDMSSVAVQETWERHLGLHAHCCRQLRAIPFPPD